MLARESVQSLYISSVPDTFLRFKCFTFRQLNFFKTAQKGRTGTNIFFYPKEVVRNAERQNTEM